MKTSVARLLKAGAAVVPRQTLRVSSQLLFQPAFGVRLASNSSTMNAPTIKYFPGSVKLEEWTQHPKLRSWVLEQIALCTPDRVYFCNGTQEEYDFLMNEMVLSGVMVKLNENKRPNSYIARSTVSDVARVESRTFICSKTQEEAGPNNHWEDPTKMREILKSKFSGCMKGRTMYVVPFCMGPLESNLSEVGVQVTDSAYAVVNMRIMTRMGDRVLKKLGTDGFFVPALHSVGVPLEKNQEDSTWPQNDDKYICHFPETKEIMSIGSGYGGNALLGKKCYALRIASVMAREQGWLAEHMLIMGVTNPAGEKKYVAAAFPSACGKTNFAMLQPSLPGWKVETVGDDIAWMRVGADGSLRAINPESGFFGVAPGTSKKTNPMALASASKNTIFTNVALTPDGDVWWDGLTSKEDTPDRLISWQRKNWYKGENHPDEAAHPNSRFTCPASQCPSIDKNWESPEGVPISAIIFGGRRSDTIPLVVESLDWEHGVYLGATLQSEGTAAAAEVKRGVLRSDPFAMKPFCGYNFGDYFAHWVSMQNRIAPEHLPKIFNVNWFRKDEDGKFIWPGFGENSRVLEWIFNRCSPASAAAIETPIGFVPKAGESLSLEGLNVSKEVVEKLLTVDAAAVRTELKRNHEVLSGYGSRIPESIWKQQQRLEERTKA